MFSLSVSAYRSGEVVDLYISGMLANSCVTASVASVYPGDVYYTLDPRESQIFIEEKLRPGSEICLTALVPWSQSVSIHSLKNHSSVAIFINGHYQASFEIQENPKKYQVISLAGFEENVGCSVIPADMLFLAIYKVVFGPDTLEQCESWVSENCDTSIMSTAGKLSTLMKQASAIADITIPTSKKGSKLKDR